MPTDVGNLTSIKIQEKKDLQKIHTVVSTLTVYLWSRRVAIYTVMSVLLGFCLIVTKTHLENLQIS